MEVPLADVCWHSHLREAMDIRLPLHYEGPGQALRILVNVGESSLSGGGVCHLPVDKGCAITPVLACGLYLYH